MNNIYDRMLSHAHLLEERELDLGASAVEVGSGPVELALELVGVVAEDVELVHALADLAQLAGQGIAS